LEASSSLSLHCLLTMALSRIVSIALVAASQGAVAPIKTPQTCGEIKTFYRDNKCCGKPAQAVTVAAKCAYDFTKPKCADAEPQAPRDLSKAATGLKTPKAATLNVAQQKMLPLANVHYHLGAEHKSDAYKLDADSKAYDAKKTRRLEVDEEIEDDDLENRMQPAGARRLATNPRPGFMCSATGLTAAEKTAYTFQYCKNVEVGKTYEIHYVHSSAATHLPAAAASGKHDSMNDGLGGAANGRGQLNPMVVVQGLVVQITNDAQAPVVNDMLHNWDGFATGRDAVMYSGSTTGPSHTNAICSPYIITWHVDKRCNKISAKSFDNFCKMMKDQHKLDADLAPHGSRIILDPRWVVKPEFVEALA